MMMLRALVLLRAKDVLARVAATCYSYAYSNGNTYAYGYTHAHVYSDSDSFTYFHAGTFTYAERCPNAPAAFHAATTPQTIYEKETHCSIRASPP